VLISVSVREGVSPMPLKRQTTANGRCKAKTKAGGPCAAPARNNSALCAFHSDPNRAAELGRKGGARNRKVYPGDVREVSVPESAADVKRMLAETMADIRARKMDPKLGSTLGYLGISLLRAFEVAEFEQRLERLEQKYELENQVEQAGTTETKGNH
jgi:general stress protein YciG